MKRFLIFFSFCVSNVGPRAAYLLGELAELEQSLLHCATARMKAQGYSPIACPEIFRTVVVVRCR